MSTSTCYKWKDIQLKATQILANNKIDFESVHYHKHKKEEKTDKLTLIFKQNKRKKIQKEVDKKYNIFHIQSHPKNLSHCTL